MNDYELLYLIVCDQDGIALEFLIKKYEKLIWKYIHNANIGYSDHDDFYQFCVEILIKAIYLFNEIYNKTFTRYFQLILQRDLWKMQKKYYEKISKVLYIEYELFDERSDSSYLTVNEELEFDYLYETIDKQLKTNLEKQIYELHFVFNLSVAEIAIKLGLNEKQVYNTITRLIGKMRNIMKK